MGFPFHAPQPAPLPPRRACVPLAHKRVPTEMRAPAEHERLVYAALLADDVDISAFRDHVLALPEDHWHEAYSRAHNVFLTRPFHDKLGVNNLMFLFSDTQLENVYELPLYGSYKHWLEPLFARIGVDPARVVRCLLARMPGKTLIPAHHDNGPWVSKTHRVHVPIVTFDDVEFKSGGLEATMTRFAFNERTIVELNNAAKHSVWNPSDRLRIHLIFDYVEDMPPLTRHVLTAGQACRQVRGRVELLASDANDKKRRAENQRKAAKIHGEIEALLTTRVSADAAASVVKACRHYFIEQISAKDFVAVVRRAVRGHAHENELTSEITPKLIEMFGLVDKYAKRELLEALRRDVYAPNWVIIGAQKCGTTSLYEYLSQHPDILKGRRREPHFFDWSWDGALKYQLADKDDALYKQILKAYAAARREGRHREDPVDDEDSIDKLDALAGNSLDDMRAKYLASLQCDEIESALRAPRQIGESTPSYLLYGERVAKRLRLLYPHVKLIVMLRDPVKRAFSHYQMTADPNGTPAQLKMREPVRGKSFEQVVDEDLALLAAAGVTPERSPLDGISVSAADAFQRYADGLSQRHGAHSFVGRGLYALQLALWLRVFPRDQILVVDLDDMKTADGTRRIAHDAFAFLGVSPHDVQDTERKNTRAYGAVDEATAQRLRAFYAPFNEQLFELLGRRLAW